MHVPTFSTKHDNAERRLVGPGVRPGDCVSLGSSVGALAVGAGVGVCSSESFDTVTLHFSFFDEVFELLPDLYFTVAVTVALPLDLPLILTDVPFVLLMATQLFLEDFHVTFTNFFTPFFLTEIFFDAPALSFTVLEAESLGAFLAFANVYSPPDVAIRHTRSNIDIVFDIGFVIFIYVRSNHCI